MMCTNAPYTRGIATRRLVRNFDLRMRPRDGHYHGRKLVTAWKNYFLTHLDRLYPKVCARKEGRFHPETSSGPVKQPLYLIKDDSQSAR